jgi:hypothetical protein
MLLPLLVALSVVPVGADGGRPGGCLDLSAAAEPPAAATPAACNTTRYGTQWWRQ